MIHLVDVLLFMSTIRDNDPSEEFWLLPTILVWISFTPLQPKWLPVVKLCIRISYPQFPEFSPKSANPRYSIQIALACGRLQELFAAFTFCGEPYDSQFPMTTLQKHGFTLENRWFTVNPGGASIARCCETRRIFYERVGGFSLEISLVNSVIFNWVIYQYCQPYA